MDICYSRVAFVTEELLVYATILVLSANSELEKKTRAYTIIQMHPHTHPPPQILQSWNYGGLPPPSAHKQTASSINL